MILYRYSKDKFCLGHSQELRVEDFKDPRMRVERGGGPEKKNVFPHGAAVQKQKKRFSSRGGGPEKKTFVLAGRRSRKKNVCPRGCELKEERTKEND